VKSAPRNGIISPVTSISPAYYTDFDRRDFIPEWQSLSPALSSANHLM
jgi:hypothetical protein